MKLKEVSILNVILCFSVVMIHLTSRIVLMMQDANFVETIIFSINSLLGFAVPAFIFLSGYKFYLRYSNEDINLKTFYFRRIKKILMPYIFAFTVYFAYYVYKGYVETDVISVLKHFVTGDMVAHFYYIIIAFQLYMLFPVLLKVYKKYPKTTISISLVLTVMYLKYVSFPYSDRVFGRWLFYFVLGFCFAKNKDKFNWKMSKYNLLLTVAFILFAFIRVRMSYEIKMYSRVFQNAEIITMIYVTLATVFAFSFSNFIADKINKIYPTISAISDNAFYIYLYHIILIQILQWEVSPRLGLTPKKELLLTFAVTYGVIVFESILKAKLLKNKSHDQPRTQVEK